MKRKIFCIIILALIAFTSPAMARDIKKTPNIKRGKIMSTTANATSTKFLEAKTAQEVLSKIHTLPKNAVIFIDIDDTIITPKSKTFRAPPQNKLIDDIKANKDIHPNYENILSKWRLQRKIMLVDSRWPNILNELKKHFFTYGLTKMNVGKLGYIESTEKWRYEELSALDIFFPKNHNISEKDLDGATFYHGIFFTGEHSKSFVIEKYLNLNSTSTIVLIDDRQEHLEDVSSFCKKNGLSFFGILFSGVSNLNEKPDPAITNIQKRWLTEKEQWLEDEEAAMQLVPSDENI